MTLGRGLEGQQERDTWAKCRTPATIFILELTHSPTALKKHPEAASDDLKGTGKHAASEPAAAPAKKARLLW